MAEIVERPIQIQEKSSPPRWKTLLLLCLAVYPTLNLVGLVCRPLIHAWPVWLASLVTLPITMLIVSYLILPWITRRLARWLNG